MEVFKITKASFSHKLTASGREHRWNVDDQYTIYTGSSRSLSSLELIVSENTILPAFKYKVMVISIADDENLFTHILQSQLPESWRTMAAYPKLQLIGSEWYTSKKSLILKVPSAVVPKE